MLSKVIQLGSTFCDIFVYMIVYFEEIGFDIEQVPKFHCRNLNAITVFFFNVV